MRAAPLVLTVLALFAAGLRRRRGRRERDRQAWAAATDALRGRAGEGTA